MRCLVSQHAQAIEKTDCCPIHQSEFLKMPDHLHRPVPPQVDTCCMISNYPLDLLIRLRDCRFREHSGKLNKLVFAAHRSLDGCMPRVYPRRAEI